MNDLIRRLAAQNIIRVYLPSCLCFLVLNVTNAVILKILVSHGFVHGSGIKLEANLDEKAHFFLVPLKAIVFLLSTAALIVPIVISSVPKMMRAFSRREVIRTLGSLFVCLALTATLIPTAFGMYYAKRSMDPFNQTTDQLYRRILVPGIAYLLHVNGFLYIYLFWGLVIAAALAVKWYLLTAGIRLMVIQEISFLTSGIFASAFQTPGYPEIAVFLLALVALVEFETDRRFTYRHIAAFALALMAHESCAMIIFLPLAFFVFGKRSWLPYLTLLGVYAIALWTNFSFHLAAPFQMQAQVGVLSARDYFQMSYQVDFIAVLFAFKALWMIVPIGIYYQYKDKPAYAYFIVSGILLAIASMYIAIDYSRIVAFATIPMLLCLVQARKKMSLRVFNAMMLLNLAVPSFYVGANSGLLTFKGAYYALYKHLAALPLPGVD